MPCPPPSQEDNVSSELVPGLSHANFCSNDGRAEENASNAECMNVIHVPLELGVLLSFTSGSVKITHQHFGPQNKTTPKRTHVVGPVWQGSGSSKNSSGSGSSDGAASLVELEPF